MSSLMSIIVKYSYLFSYLANIAIFLTCAFHEPLLKRYNTILYIMPQFGVCFLIIVCLISFRNDSAATRKRQPFRRSALLQHTLQLYCGNLRIHSDCLP